MVVVAHNPIACAKSGFRIRKIARLLSIGWLQAIEVFEKKGRVCFFTHRFG